MSVEDGPSSFPPWYLDRVAPELRPLVPGLAGFEAAHAPLDEASLPALRRAYLAACTGAGTETRAVERRLIEGAPGHPAVEIFIVNADPRRHRPALLHLHGGGFVMGSAMIDLERLERLATRLDMVMVSVEYRLAPETDWRGSSADNHAALRWLHAHAGEVGADPARIGLLGESAGGGHAAILSAIARDRGDVPIAFQCLVYPMLDDRTGSVRPVPPHLGVVGWPAQFNRFGWSAFLRTAAGSTDVPVAAVPARQNDLRGLPPTWMGVGDLDLFVAEDLAFGAALARAGVPVDMLSVPGAFHGFDEACRLARHDAVIAGRFEDRMLSAISQGLGR